jgi:hypothetical protein
MSPLVTVMSRFARGWPDYPSPRDGDADRAWVVPLSAALSLEFGWDAHMTGYVAEPGRNRRMRKGALDAGVVIHMTCAAFDFDCHGLGPVESDEWRQQWRAQAEMMRAAHPDPFLYESSGGARAIYLLREPFVIRTHEDARRWSQLYLIACAYLRRRFGLIADPACNDWQRMYRLPFVVRDGSRQTWPVFGNPIQLGPLVIEGTAADKDAAARLRPRVFGVASCSRRRNGKPVPGKLGILYHALHARGDVFEARADGSFIVRCPNESEHGKDTTGTDSTVLFLPAAGDELGWLLCRHGHCEGKTAAQWLSLFTAAELDAARTRARIVRIDWARLLGRSR